jgi:hypothetical protein
LLRSWVEGSQFEPISELGKTQQQNLPSESCNYAPFDDFSGFKSFPAQANDAMDISTQSWIQMGSMLNRPAMGPAFAQIPSFNNTNVMQPLCHAGNDSFNQCMMDPGMLPLEIPIPLNHATLHGQLMINPGILPSQPPTPLGYATVQNQATVSALPAATAFACTQPGCQAMFKRYTDRIRHEASKHGINGMLYFCQIVGCPKSFGAGYTRKDKLTEHMWKKHANLGYVKRV